jgi:hypothetical protein
MHTLGWFGVLFFVLLLVCVFLCLTPDRRGSKMRRCPRTMAEAHHSRTIKYEGKCYQVFTCSEACGKSIAKLVEDSAPAFAEKYGAERREVQGEPGLHLRHHISKEPVQFALEVAC